MTVEGNTSIAVSASPPTTAQASQQPAPKKAKKAKTTKKTENTKKVKPAQQPAHVQSPSTGQKGKSVEGTKTNKKVKPPQQPAQIVSKSSLSSQKSKGVERTKIKGEDHAESSASARDDPSSQTLVEEHVAATTNILQIFSLAATTPISISPKVERQFYESQLLLYVLEKVRGDHSKRQNYHGELDQDATGLRRSFVDKLAYICDFKKGGSTVTALALQKTYQGVTFWLAANETVKPKVIDFLSQILQLLKKVEVGASKKTTEMQLLALIVPFNEGRLDYYWSALRKDLKVCVGRLETLEGSTSKSLLGSPWIYLDQLFSDFKQGAHDANKPN